MDNSLEHDGVASSKQNIQIYPEELKMRNGWTRLSPSHLNLARFWILIRKFTSLFQYMTPPWADDLPFCSLSPAMKQSFVQLIIDSPNHRQLDSSIASTTLADTERGGGERRERGEARRCYAEASRRHRRGCNGASVALISTDHWLLTKQLLTSLWWSLFRSRVAMWVSVHVL